MADIVVVAKASTASDADVQRVSESAARINPAAAIVRAASPVQLEEPDKVRGKRVLVVEDGPTITHGGMPYGAGFVAATQAQPAEIVDPRISAVEEISKLYRLYPHIGSVLPAVGYHPSQLEALRQTINSSDADTVVSATPCDLGALIEFNKPLVRVGYEFAELGHPKLSGLIQAFLKKRKLDRKT